MTRYLEEHGVANIEMLNGVIDRYAKPWFDRYGGLDELTITE